MRVTPCSRTEDRRDRHISAGRLAGASIELRELEHFDHRVARLTACKIRYCKAAAIKGPLRQRLTAEEVDSDGNVCPHFYDRVERYGRQGNSINQPLLASSPWSVEARDCQRRHERFPQWPRAYRRRTFP